jgi:transposase
MLLANYLFDADFCNPASGWEKGQVEKSVQEALLLKSGNYPAVW